jgi:thiol-disulfide isomerase/thioredoxin
MLSMLQAAVRLFLISAMVLPAIALPTLVDLQGRSVSHLAEQGDRAVVLIFVATDCPISRRYIPEIAQIEREFAGQRVAFWWVFPNPGDSAAVVRSHEVDYSIHARTIIDSKQELVNLGHVSVTPEVAVFAVKDSELREMYHGRIDDRYIAFGKQRPAATRHDLEDAVKAVLANRPVAVSSTPPIGCSIVPLAANQGVPIRP